MRARDLTKGSIAYHDTLNQDVWSGSELRVDVRYRLLEIAKRFVEYLDVPDFKLVDVILRGSLTNYNYTQYSDFDLHIVTDYAALDCDITEPFYMAKKKIWNDEHDITIKGHEVELYVEDRDEKNVSEGMYSVLDNTWHKRPKYQQPDIDDRAVNSKARDLMTQINRAVKTGSVEDITRLQDKIRNMRQSGLDAGGEFSTENLAFKIIRNKGYLTRLYKNKNSKFDQELSLDEGIKQNTAVAALVAALSGAPATADYNYPETQKQDPNAVQKALIILRSINKMKNYGQAGFEAEAQQELNNIMRSMQGMPNQSRVYPIIKDLIKSPEPLPPLYDPSYTPPKDDVNERKKAKKKKRKTKARRYGYPGMGYYGYYYGGNHDHADSGAGDAGGGGDGGGGESMYESEARLDSRVEEFLDGLTPDDVGRDEVGDYIVHYEGFTDQCQDSEEYQANPEAVFQDVWGDFKRRMGDRDPINYGIVGSEEYPIVYSVFRKNSLKEFIEKLITIKKGSWLLYESKGSVEFRKSSMFDQTVANKARQAPNLVAKVSSFVDSKTINPTQPWGSKDRPFGAKGPIGMAMPKLHYAHLNTDLVLFYEIEGRDPTVIKLYGVFSHDDIGIGQPGNIRKQKSLIQQLGHQKV